MMFKKKVTKQGPATQAVLDYWNGKYTPTPEQEALLAKQEAENYARLTHSEKIRLKEREELELFNKKWVSRSDYEKDIELARYNAASGVWIIFALVIVSMLAFSMAFYNQRNEHWIDCGKLSSSSIKYLDGVGEELPIYCSYSRQE